MSGESKEFEELQMIFEGLTMNGMDDILTELNLETLAAVFPREIIVLSIVRSMSNEKIE